MQVKLVGFALDPTGAQHLRTLLSSGESNAGVTALVEHVISLGATFAIVEAPYIDQDYSADYVAFYASAFRDYPRQTKRIHFFQDDVSSILGKPVAEQQDLLAAAPYLGFVVLRPIAQGPIGRTMLKFPTFGGKLTVRPAARADAKAHLLGSKLIIERAAPFIQQDERIASCAQAAIWMAARPVHERYRRTPWYSMAEITRLATTPTDADLSRSLPSGSGGLSPIHIIRAFRGMGHQPLFDFFISDDDPVWRTKKPRKPSPEAARSIVRYLDSGLPVAIALSDVGDDVGHAVTAVGTVEGQGPPSRKAATFDCFVRALLVHDDQRGPYRLMALTNDDVRYLPRDRLLIHDGRPVTVERDATYMFVPLPSRVLLRADRADTVVSDYLKNFVDKVGPGMIERFGKAAPASKREMNAFYRLVRKDQIIRRTYLTTAARYRAHIADSQLSEEIKAELLLRTLPHFVWVTELLSAVAKYPLSEDARDILGHMVVNAASSSDPHTDLLVAHLPHVVVHRDVNPPFEENVPFKESAVFFDTHVPYSGRRRR